MNNTNEWDERVEAFVSLWKRVYREKMEPCSDCGGFVVHVCEKALREMLTAQIKKMDETVAAEIKKERESRTEEVIEREYILRRKNLEHNEECPMKQGMHLKCKCHYEDCLDYDWKKKSGRIVSSDECICDLITAHDLTAKEMLRRAGLNPISRFFAWLKDPVPYITFLTALRSSGGEK